MLLSDSFPEEYKEVFEKLKLKIGSVIRVHVLDTDPPKVKRFILVGQSYDKLIFASIYINTEINPNVFPTPELKDLNVKLTVPNRSYLKHDSFADCSQLVKRKADWLYNLIKDDADKLIGEVSPQDLKEIREKIKSARTISPSEKKNFGLFL